MLGKNKKDINAWAKELKHNEKFSKKYEGLKTVEGILATAKKDGYDIKKEELMNLDLDSVAGGVFGLGLKGVDVNVRTFGVKNQKASIQVGSGGSNHGNISMK